MSRLDTLSAQLPSLDIREKVAYVYLNNPPLNALGYSVRTSIMSAFDKAESTPGVEVIVITGRGKAFSAGADITEFSGKMKAPFLPEVLNRIEKSKKVVVAAVNGVAMGGGCELALACHYRICDAAAIFALPEIKLGLIPGAGGTQRLPRLVGVPNALDMCCSGRNIRSNVAAKWGLVDKVAQTNLLVEAMELGLNNVKRGPRRMSEDTSKLGNGIKNFLIFRTARKQMSAKLPKDFTSPLKAMDAVQAATQVSTFEEGLKAEEKIFMSCAKSWQAAGMIHFFGAERRALKIPGVNPKDLKPKKVRSVGIIGGGTMGGGIAMCFMNVGVPVVLLETAEDKKKLCVENIARNYNVTVAKGKMTKEKMNQRMSLLNVVVGDWAALQDVDYVIEAVFESMDLKKKIFTKLDQICKQDCVLASNTSTLSIDEIASATSRPNKVIGAHFFSPANVMKLLEFVRGKNTDQATIAQSMAIGKLIKKAPVVVGNCFGFVSNRMILTGGYQIGCMMEDGALPLEVDRLIGPKGFGFPMGIISMQDLAGLDVGSKIRKETPKEVLEGKRDVSTISEELVKQGRFGQKTGKGWFTYAKENPRKPIPDPSVDALVVKVSKQKGIKRRHHPDKEIVERYIFAMVNEAAKILDEGFAYRPSDIDIVFIYGFGYPPWKGGPCHYADSIGLQKVVETMNRFTAALGPSTFPPPCEFLQRMAREGKTFASLNQ